MPLCWMCEESEATTGEHIFKHTVLRNLYKDVTFKKGDRLVSRSQKEHNGRIVDSKKIIQSTDADEFKFIKSLCEICNGAKSKKWDDEFDRFIEYLLYRWKESLSNGYINLKLSHPKCSKADSRNLYNYFCKLFGCLLFSKGFPVPNEVVSAVNGLNYSNGLGVNAVFDIDLESIGDFGSYLVSHDLTGDHLEGQMQSVSENCRWALGFGPIKLAFWYRTPLIFVIGEPWYGKSKRIGFARNA
jgi:hypothetical protein